MSLKIGVVMDPIDHIKPWKDTTLAMLLEAQRRGWSIQYMEPADLYVRDGEVRAVTRDLVVRDNNDDWFTLGEPAPRALAGLDMILMRQDPPFNSAYLYATYMLEKVEREGVMVVNKPASVRDSNEKLFATDFPQCCVPTLVSGRADRLREFVKEQGDTVMKPLDAMGGTNVFRIEPGSANLSVIIDVLTENGKTPVMAQRFIPEIKDGDKRILMINGEPVDYALARIPKEGEFRGNLAAGGTGQGRELTDRDRWICQQVGPVLREKGLYFVGLDVIGDYVTEINVTSPTCVRELDQIYGINIAGQLFDALLELRG
ncbi:glutathione synthase [Alloalcanivorax gelatiniphagus]|uniref:Glutathione synthetase n=1 Tax=Alloalcanivorax gelatiniphagus TaxID=1194167 RepID=A0ABY2XGM8_9GAMM|nr:glutathione synthase [Alloalcanivorax gelatiniphagus]TMW10827.1 glutathione synthase [Alloalcanivorax gelatiniphagus]